MKCSSIVFGIILFVTICAISSIDTNQQIPECEMENMLLSVSDFPGVKWVETGDRDKTNAPARMGIDKVGTGFSTVGQGGATQHIYRFGNLEDAREEYEDAKRWWFNLAPIGSAWSIPTELQELNLNADDYKLECAEIDEKPIIEYCFFIGLYQNDIVMFNTSMSMVYYDDLISLLDKIDQNMRACMETRAK